MQDNQKQTHWAYIAGIMDADGCFMIQKHARKTKNRTSDRAKEFPKTQLNWSGVYAPSLKIAMIEPEAMELLVHELKVGNMHLCGARTSRPNSQRIYQWWERNWRDVIPFIENVLPYLRVKTERALHLLEFCHHLEKCKNPCYRGHTKEELDYREEMYLKMRQLNGSKVAATTKS